MRCLLVLAAALPAVELPVTHVTLLPDGALVEHGGALDGTPITGLPADAQQVTATVAGDDAPRWSWAVTRPPAQEDTQAKAREALEAKLREAEADLTRAQRRLALAALVTEDQPAPATPGVLPPPPALPTPAQQEALTRFLDASTAATQAEVAAATARRDAARSALDALVAQPALPLATGVVTLAGAPGTQATVRYRLSGLRWSPAYRLEVTGQDATLVLLARIQDDRGLAWTNAPVSCDARRPERRLQLGGFTVPTWGSPEAVARLLDPVEPGLASEVDEGGFLAIGAGGGSAGMLGSRSGGGKKRAISRSGGSKGSENSVGSALSYWSHWQRADGSVGDAPWQPEVSALSLLSLLGAGYDHKTPSKFKPMAQSLLAWVQQQAPEDLRLSALAYGACALAEAYAMTSDPELKPLAQRWLQVLDRRSEVELGTEITRNGPFAGVETLVAGVMAGKSGLAAGLDAGGLLTRGKAWLPRLDRRQDEQLAAALVMEVFTGQSPNLPPDRLDDLIQHQQRWWHEGRLAPLYHATLALFQIGGTPWKRWNDTLRDFLVSQQIRSSDASDGGYNAPHPAGFQAATAYATLTLEVYYRYAQVAKSASSPAVERPAPPPESFDDPQTAAQGWPLVWQLPSAPTGRGRSVVEVARVALPGAVTWKTFPVADTTVWRHLEATNPLPTPLPTGPCRLVLDGDERGTTPLAFAPPGGALRLPLGADTRLRVDRTTTSTSDDGWRKRTVEASVTLHLTAPPGFTGTVTAMEPLPRLAHEDLVLEVVSPVLDEKELARRRAEDPYWRQALTVAQPASTISYRLRWPKAMTPVLEFAP